MGFINSIVSVFKIGGGGVGFIYDLAVTSAGGKSEKTV